MFYKIKNKYLRILLEFLYLMLFCQIIMAIWFRPIFYTFSNWIYSSVYGLVLGYIMMKGNSYIGNKLEAYFPWLKAPIKRFFAIIFLGSIFTAIVTSTINYIYFCLIFNQPFSSFLSSNYYSLLSSFTIYFIISAIVYIIIFYNKWKNLAIEQEKQKTESLKLRFEVLRNHVNPHFLFNSLSTLTHLIELDKDKAIEFTNLLSENYRFIIDTKDKDLVPLDEEIAFVDSYLRLQSIRYGKLVEVQNRITNNDSFQVIPVSVQMLIENVFKHNVISKDSKIVIELWIENDYLYVKNNINAKNDSDDRTPTGLANIRARYEYLSNHECVFGKQGNDFVVALPLLKRS